MRKEPLPQSLRPLKMMERTLRTQLVILKRAEGERMGSDPLTFGDHPGALPHQRGAPPSCPATPPRVLGGARPMQYLGANLLMEILLARYLLSASPHLPI